MKTEFFSMTNLMVNYKELNCVPQTLMPLVQPNRLSYIIKSLATPETGVFTASTLLKGARSSDFQAHVRTTHPNLIVDLCNRKKTVYSCTSYSLKSTYAPKADNT